MGLFDFLTGKTGHKNKWAKQKEEKPVEVKKIDLGVCVPIHIRTADERKKIRKEPSPFEKLIKDHEKELGHMVKDIEQQEPEEPYDFAPELGVEGIGPAETEQEQSINQSDEKKDELDIASKKMSQGYVPKFSAAARKKLGYETEQAPTKNTSNEYGQFEVTGVYLGAETMISGRIVSGKITRRMSAPFGKNTIRITDLKKGITSANELNEGEHGTIFTRASLGLLKTGEVLEFS